MKRKAWIVALAWALAVFPGCKKETGEKKPSLTKPADFSAKDNHTVQTPLDEAAAQCNREMEALLSQPSGKKSKPTPCAIDALLKAVEQDDRGKITTLVNLYDGILNTQKEPWAKTALAKAYYSGNKSLMEFLIAKGADVNEGFMAQGEMAIGVTLVEEAVCDQKKDMAAFLLHNGANVNVTDGEGSGPLICTINLHDLEMAKLILDHGANLEMKYNMEFDDLPEKQNWEYGTVLPYTIKKGYPDMAELFLERGANPNAKNDFGRTPLFVAIHKGDKKSVTLLLAHGAKVNLKDKRGTTPLHFAVLSGQKEIADLLRQHGAVE